MCYFKKYWLEVLVFGLIFAVLLICCLPAMTWINTDSDGAHYILSAKYMGVAHNTSAPLYLLLGRLFLFIPFGTDAWLMGLISVFATTICSIFIYKSVVYNIRKLAFNKINQYAIDNWDGLSDKDDFPNYFNQRLYGLIASLIYGGSALVITQSTIIETYALSTMLSVIVYYACLRNRYLMASISMGLILAVHPLFFLMTWFVLMIAHKPLRSIKYLIITFSFVLFYLYIPITKMFGEVPSMWGNTSLYGFFRNNFGTMWMLAGGLSLYDIPKRIIDTVLILLISMGLSLFVLIWYFIKTRTWRSSLMWLFVIPVFYFIVNLSAETYVYMMPAIAFGVIAVGIALSKVNRKIVYATGLVAIVLLFINAWFLDIGRTLDPNMSAQTYYDKELPKISDGEIYLGGGWTWAIVFLYNRETGSNIIPICTDVLPSGEYLDMLEKEGIKLTRTNSESYIDKQWEVAKSIALQNDNVWISKEISPERLEYEIVPSKENMELIDRWLGYNKPPTIAWKPSNPYKYITGALEVEEWKFILKTNHNARFAMIWAVYGLGFCWLIEKLFGKKHDKNKKKKVADAR